MNLEATLLLVVTMATLEMVLTDQVLAIANLLMNLSSSPVVMLLIMETEDQEAMLLELELVRDPKELSLETMDLGPTETEDLDPMEIEELRPTMALEAQLEIVDSEDLLEIMDLEALLVIEEPKETIDLEAIEVPTDLEVLQETMDSEALLVIADLEALLEIMDLEALLVIMDLEALLVIEEPKETMDLEAIEVTTDLEVIEVTIDLEATEVTIDLVAQEEMEVLLATMALEDPMEIDLAEMVLEMDQPPVAEAPQDSMETATISMDSPMEATDLLRPAETMRSELAKSWLPLHLSPDQWCLSQLYSASSPKALTADTITTMMVRSTTGILASGRSLDLEDSEHSMRLWDLKFVRDLVSSDIPQIVINFMNAIGTSGLRSLLFTFSPVLLPWLSDNMMSPSLPVTGPSLVPPARRLK